MRTTSLQCQRMASLHANLIGKPGSRALLNTPALVVSLPKLDRNIQRMSDFAATHKLRLRPHSKTHKSVEISKRQIAAGACGVCCAKLGEAEALSEGGIENILITSPVVGAGAIARLASLARKCTGLMAVVDHPCSVDAIQAAMRAEEGAALTLLVDIDPGMRRTGVASAQAAVELAQKIEAASGPFLTYGGVQFYCGVSQHIQEYAARRAAFEEKDAYLSTTLAELARAGLPARLVTGGGTGSHAVDAELGVLTEIQPGSYVFMDRQYNDCELSPLRGGNDDGEDPAGEASTAAASASSVELLPQSSLDSPPASPPFSSPFETSLFVDVRVISANHPGCVTVDAGLKALSSEDGVPPVSAGAPLQSTFRFMGDEHGILTFPEDADAAGTYPGHGDVVSFVAPHCDPTVNLYDYYHLVAGEGDRTLVDIWPIQGRGRCQ